jgi:hypothetical protein
LKPYTCADFPGWNLAIPDSLRTDVFLREFEEYQKKGEWPNLVLIYLPQDHTSGDGADSPSPRAMVADNDLALGRIVEAITKSKFWPETCIFVNEDDAQNGLDHVDGHRSLCLVVSPYSKRKQVVSTFYNQTSVLHTMELMLGLPPMNQNDAFSPAMYDCFVNKPDLTPFDALKNNIALDEPNGKHGRRTELEHPPFDLTRPDRIDEDAFNRVLWKLARGDERYPVEFAGPHGRGLKQLKLMLDKSAEDDDDDDDDAQGTPQKN